MNSNSSRRRLAALVLILALTGCTAGGYPASGAAPAQDSAPLPQATQVPEENGPTPDRQIVRTGSLTIRTPDIEKAAADLRALATATNGFVSSEQISVTEGDGAAGSRVVLSVPSESLTAVMDQAAKVGELVNRGITAQDVTAQVADVEARIRTLRESIGRIRLLMKRAGSIADVARVEAELTQRQSDLEALLATQKSLTNRVERSPITVTLIKPGQVDPQNPLWTGLVRGWEALQNSISALLTLIGGVLPFALVGGVIAWPIVRRFRKRAAAAKAPTTPPTESTRSES